MTTKEIKKAAGIIIQDRKLLVERSINKEHFIAPGGTMEPGETPIQTLIRELKEEFQIDVEEPDLVEFGMFKADAAGLDNTTVTMHVYMVKNYLGNITPDNEVEELLWLTSEIPDKIKVGSIFEHEVIPRLKQQNLID